MAESVSCFSEYRAVWLIVMFDLPVTTSEGKKNYVRFRNRLLDEGFTMLQFSVYTRFFGSIESAAPHKKKIKKHLPPDGKVKILTITDKQFGKIDNFQGKKTVPNEEKPSQLALF